MIKCNTCKIEKPDNYYYVHDEGKEDKMCKLCNKRMLNKIEVPDNHRMCYECSTIKPLEDFHKHKVAKEGRATRCKKCSCRYQLKRTKDINEGVIEQNTNTNIAEIYMNRYEVIGYGRRILDTIKRNRDYVSLMDIGDIIECYQQMSGKINLSYTMKSGEEIVAMVAYITEVLKKEE